ncbi:MAG: DUF4838 domain-containing protein [Lentisphaerae bacterium]|jgi:hypothetical protein|nr:DUF4838 domain-containing protein [Lentisphaerota bacterium]MBT5607440.1 DUF4838 domain-containing protein [Lentisphaerota bacterium]MBT7054123.1 DUF4838 domain-containing protein [Lentisphaerota bacterium]MBT7842063.1 DUF4838 domain-containing protein [Lentisphaerota bacterium]
MHARATKEGARDERTQEAVTTMRRFCSLLVCSVLFSAGHTLAAAPFLVKAGQAQSEIVISGSAAPIVRIAAQDLQGHILKMTGAVLPIVNAPSEGGNAQIYVGRSSHTDRLDVSVDDLRHGAYRMVSGPNWLVLIGRDREWAPGELMQLAVQKRAWVAPDEKTKYSHPLWQRWDALTGEHWGLPFSQLWKQYNKKLDLWEMDERGSLNAVAAFLRMHGVRWYMPGEIGTIIPPRKSIPLPTVDKIVRPDFEVRYPYLYTMRFASGGDNLMWQLHMGFSQAPDVVGEGYRGHGISHVIGREETKKAHPEFYALMGGKRITRDRFAKHGRPCLSSPALIEANVHFLRAMFDAFDLPMESVMPVDGFTSICQCELCKGKGQPERGWRGQFSNYVWNYCNEVAKGVYETHPDRALVGMGYTTYMEPPTNVETLSPNLIVCIAQHRSAFGQDPETCTYFRDLRTAWRAKMSAPGKNLYMYDYYRYAVPGKAHRYMPAFFPHAIADDLRSLKSISLGDYVETYTSGGMGVTFLNMYVTGRCWWDADLDIDRLLEEYYASFYGPAQAEMKAFLEYAEANWMDLKKVAKIEKVFALMAAAEAKAPAESVVAERVALIADYIKPLEALRTQLSAPRDPVPRAVLVTRDDAKLILDGKLDEPVWKQLRTNGLRDLKTGKSTKVKTRFHIFWQKGALFVGIVCHDPDMGNLTIATETDDDTSVWDGDEVEVLIETQVHSYYQLCISPSGALADIDQKKGMNTLWASNAEVGVHRGAAAWTIEIRIPIASEGQADVDPNNGLAGRMPSNTYPWYFNVCRQRCREGKLEHWAFSPTGRGFQRPRKFAEMGGIIRDPKERARKKEQRAKWLELWK